MCGKKNPLWETELELFTRSVPFWQGRTVVRGSLSEALLEVSVTYESLHEVGYTSPYDPENRVFFRQWIKIFI